MTVGEWLASAQARLAAAGFEAARLEAQLLAAHAFLVDRVWILAHPEAEFPEFAGESLLMRRLAGEPLAYILGWREFYGRRFSVRPGVLVPRQETEVLIDAALADKRGNLRVLDIGTGSGILAIALKLERPDWDVTAIDISPLALEVARQNATDLHAPVHFVEGDLFEAADGEFDLIVSNPPYIGINEDLPADVRNFEPKLALFAGESGLDIYKRLAEEGREKLKPGGRLMLELGKGQLPAVTSLFEAAGWQIERYEEDLLGIPRVLVLSQ